MNPRGARHYAAKLSEADARAIIGRAELGEGLASIASDYPQVSKVSVHNVIHGKTWAYLGERVRFAPRPLGRFTTSALMAELGHRGFRIPGGVPAGTEGARA